MERTGDHAAVENVFLRHSGPHPGGMRVGPCGRGSQTVTGADRGGAPPTGRRPRPGQGCDAGGDRPVGRTAIRASSRRRDGTPWDGEVPF